MSDSGDSIKKKTKRTKKSEKAADSPEEISVVNPSKETGLVNSLKETNELKIEEEIPKEKKARKKKATKEEKEEFVLNLDIFVSSQAPSNSEQSSTEDVPKKKTSRKKKMSAEKESSIENEGISDEAKKTRKKTKKTEKIESIVSHDVEINNDFEKIIANQENTKEIEEIIAPKNISGHSDIEKIEGESADAYSFDDKIELESDVLQDTNANKYVGGTGLSVDQDKSLEDLFSFDEDTTAIERIKIEDAIEILTISEIIPVGEPKIEHKKLKNAKKKEGAASSENEKFAIVDDLDSKSSKHTDLKAIKGGNEQNLKVEKNIQEIRKDQESNIKELENGRVLKQKESSLKKKEEKSQSVELPDEKFIIQYDKSTSDENVKQMKKKKESFSDMEFEIVSKGDPIEVVLNLKDIDPVSKNMTDVFRFDEENHESQEKSLKNEYNLSNLPLQKSTSFIPTLEEPEYANKTFSMQKQEQDTDLNYSNDKSEGSREEDISEELNGLEEEVYSTIDNLEDNDFFLDDDKIEEDLKSEEEEKGEENNDRFFEDDFTYKDSTDEIKGWELQVTYIPEEFYTNTDVILTFDNEKPYNSGQGFLFFWLATRVRGKYDVSYIDRFILDIFPDVPIEKFQPAKITLGFTRNWIGFRQNKPTMLCTIRHVIGKYILPEHLVIPFTLIESSKRCSDSIKAYIYATKLALDLISSKKVYPVIERIEHQNIDDSERGTYEKNDEEEKKYEDSFVVRWRLLIREQNDLNRFRYLINNCPLSCFNLPINLEIIGKKMRTKEFWHPSYLFSTYMDDVANIIIWKSQKMKKYQDLKFYKEVHGYKKLSRDKIEWLKTTLNKSDSEIREMHLNWHVKYLMSAVRPRFPIKKLDLFDKVNLTGMNSWVYPLMANDSHNCFILGFQINFPKPRQNGVEKSKNQRQNFQLSSNDWFIDFQYVPIESYTKLLPLRIFWEGLDKIRSKGGYRSMIYVRPKLIEEIMLSLSYLSHIFPSFWDKYSQTDRIHRIKLKNKQILELMKNLDDFKKAGYYIQFPKEFDLSGKYRVTTKLIIEPKQKQKEKISATMGPAVGIDTLLEFKWNIYIGDELITIEDFEEIAKSGQRLVQWKGKWILLEKEDLEAIKNVINQRPQGTISQIEALSMALKKTVYLDIKDKKFGPYEVELDQDFKAIIDRILQRENFVDVECPKIINGELRAYQRKGLNWLKNMSDFGLGVILADDMGLGKTIQVISFLGLIYEQHKSQLNPILIICPTSLIGNWKKEFEKFAPTLSKMVMIHYGPKRIIDLSEFIVALKTMPIVICSYETMKRDIEILKNIYWDSVILDESQNIKNPSTKRTKSVYQLNVRFKVCLSGTPIENNLKELWSIFNFINPMLLGTQAHFRQNYVLPIEKLKDQTVSNQLKNIISPFLLRRKKNDKTIIQDLPEKTESILPTHLTNEQAILYKKFVDDAFATLEYQKANKIKKTAAVLRLITILKQLCNHPSLILKEKVSISECMQESDEIDYHDIEDDEVKEVQSENSIMITNDSVVGVVSQDIDENAILQIHEEEIGEIPEEEPIGQSVIQSKEMCITNKKELIKFISRSEKLQRTIEMVEEILNSDQKCLIFTQYVQMGKLLKLIIEYLFDSKVLFLHGQIPGQVRDEYVELFQDPESDYKIFILTLKVGGTGLNLTEASYVIHFDRWWNPAVENQATDRAYRIGQTKPIQVYKFVAEGTIEEKINQLIEEKKELMESIVGTRSQKWITELSDTELKQLFQYGELIL